MAILARRTGRAASAAKASGTARPAIALIPEDLAQERFGQAGIQSSIVRNNLAIALGSVGRFAEAFGRAHEAIHIAEEAGHVYSLIYPLLGLGTLKLDQGDFAGAVAPLERGLDLCRKREIPLLLPDFTWVLGAAYHGTGRRAEGVALMEDAARGVAERTVRWSWWAGRLGALGVTYLLAGRLYPEMDMRFWLEKATEMKKMGG